jgi:hypothetical protein
MGVADSSRNTFLVHLDTDHQVQSQQQEVVDIFVGEGFTVQMGMDTAKTHQPPRSKTVAVQLRDLDMLVITDNHISDVTTAGNQKGDLSLNLLGKGGYLPGRFPGDDLL